MATLIFDFDGTLADNFNLMLDIAYRVTGMPPLSASEIHRLRQLPAMKVRKELGIPLRHVPRLVTRGRREMHERIGEVRAFSGIPTALAALRQTGHRLLIMTSNSERNVHAFLEAQGLEHYFEAIHSGVGVFDKAGALRKVLRRGKLDKQHCWYIGDEVRDMTAAHKAGVHAVAVGWGYQAPEALAAAQPDGLVRRPRELVAFFAQNPV